jgi:anti-sigma factor RsiW
MLESPSNPASGLCPDERWLARFASNEMGPQRKKKVTRHMESCAACRGKVARHHEMARRYRDFERQAISAY